VSRAPVEEAVTDVDRDRVRDTVILPVTLGERVVHAVADDDRVPDGETDTEGDGVPVPDTDEDKVPLRDFSIDVDARADAENDAVVHALADALTEREIEGDPLADRLPLALGVAETDEEIWGKREADVVTQSVDERDKVGDTVDVKHGDAEPDVDCETVPLVVLV
jgi:hypothetical protein